MQIKLATWNINSVRLRIDQVLRFLKEESPDVLGLQEIKCETHLFPKEPFINAGYKYIEVHGMKGYHGAATISKLPLQRLNTKFCPLGHSRHVSTLVSHKSLSFEFHNFYIPAGGDIADPEENEKFKHKLDFIENMRSYFSMRYKKVPSPQVLVGDFNIAPHENDVWNHKQLLKVVSHTPVEVSILKGLQKAHNFIDCSRALYNDEDKLFSWWSYRGRNPLESNRGRRLDHIWVSSDLKKAIEYSGKEGHIIHTPCRIWEPKPSDHVPITQILNLI